MKKLLLATLFLGGIIVPMSADSLYIQTAEGESLNGETYVFDGVEYYKNGNKTEVYIDPDLYIYSDTDRAVNVLVEANVPVQLCTIDQCEYGEKVEKLNVPLIAGTPRSLVFDYSETVADIESYVLPAIEAVITVSYVDDPSSAVKTTVKMGDVNAGVESVGADQNGVVFNGSSLNYDVNGTANLSVYSLSGKTVMAKSVSGSGSLALDGLSKGIYVYKLTNKNGQAVKAAKIIIK